MKLHLPKDYKSALSSRETQNCIKDIKDEFQRYLSLNLRLQRVSAPLFVLKGTGINDDLKGSERKVSFKARGIKGETIEIVNSLAKWKRMFLAKEGILPGTGIWTDMNAIWRDEVLDNTHSLYVDQWDWERVMTKEERNQENLMAIVSKIFGAMKIAELYISDKYGIVPVLPDTIIRVTAEELERLYPKHTRKEREDLITAQKKAVFLQGIGWDLKDGEPHDGRAPDYDDWKLNGDILVWNPVLQNALELSSMGIRVDQETLIRQLEKRGALDRKGLKYHKALLEGKLPLSVGGGIGQSRLCMFFLRKAHIGEVQASEWPQEMIAELEKNGIQLLSIY